LNEWSFVTELNYKAAFAEQEGKCLTCKKTLDINSEKNFVWIDDTHKDVYCESCGKEILKNAKTKT
jgi:DNA-directed RNA polymerase subunit RPC12/RpoP